MKSKVKAKLSIPEIPDAPKLFACTIHNTETGHFRAIGLTDDLGDVINSVRVGLRDSKSAYRQFADQYELVYWDISDGARCAIPFATLCPEDK